jgi:hypothetical protein
MQQGEAKKASTQHLWNYVQQHGRWVETLYPGADNYLAINRANSARAELNRRINTTDNALNRN